MATSDEPPKISIITPCYNRADFIRHAIESVMAQDYPNYEHIVVDGASTDGTLEILAEYPHLRVLSEPDNGLYDAVNKGLQLAQGDLIGWLNSDDRYMADTFHNVAHAFQANPHVDMVCGDTVDIEENEHGQGNVTGYRWNSRRPQFDIVALKEGWHINAYFIAPRVYEQVGPYSLAYRVVSDADFLYRLSLCRRTMVHVGGAIYANYVHEGSLTKSRAAETKLHYWQERACVERDWIQMRTQPANLREYCQGRLAGISFKLVHEYIESRRWDQAAKWLWFAYQYAPKQMSARIFKRMNRLWKKV
jgi:glycosyltransferase involved in cell wall biosynthesis